MGKELVVVYVPDGQKELSEFLSANEPLPVFGLEESHYRLVVERP